MIIYPAQCDCGHLYLEKYQFNSPLDNGVIGFCWCGFCQTRKNVYNKPRFKETWCSQCGKDFGPGDHGYSHCIDHEDIKPTSQRGKS